MGKPSRGLNFDLLITPVGILAAQNAPNHVAGVVPHPVGDGKPLTFRLLPEEIGHRVVNNIECARHG